MVEGFRKVFRGGPTIKESARSQAMADHRAEGGHVGSHGGGFSHADELPADAEDADGDNGSGQRGRDGEGGSRRGAVALHTADAMEGRDLPTGGGYGD